MEKHDETESYCNRSESQPTFIKQQKRPDRAATLSTALVETKRQVNWPQNFDTDDKKNSDSLYDCNRGSK